MLINLRSLISPPSNNERLGKGSGGEHSDFEYAFGLFSQGRAAGPDVDCLTLLTALCERAWLWEKGVGLQCCIQTNLPITVP